VLTVTTDHQRMRSMIDALRKLHVLQSSGPNLFLFGLHNGIRASDPVAYTWQNGTDRSVKLV
jgi:hypothetical protein